MGEYLLELTFPRGEIPTVEFGRHFCVSGRILSDYPLPEDALLEVRLLDTDGVCLRHCRQERKDNPNLYVDHPDLVCYDEEADPKREGIKRFGFPELMVKDLCHPEQSLKDATIKCWYSDSVFKAIIVSASDREHGLFLDDGMGYLDENGKPYTVIPRGKYILSVTLSLRNGSLLANVEKEILITDRQHQAICRFNPISHKERMIEWCHKIGISISEETLPGYLDPYLGSWKYHMGLLPMYRANDIAFYDRPKIHMFVYLIDPTSTSYETELAYLQAKGAVGDQDRFVAYHYDIGEAMLRKGEGGLVEGRIVPFERDRYLSLCRVDVVNERARENVFDLGETAVKRSVTRLDGEVTVSAGEDIAIMGVVRPWQLDGGDFVLTRENVYRIGNAVCRVHYSIEDGEIRREEDRELMLERIDGEPIGRSVYEFYNLFHVGKEMKGKRIKIRVAACDKGGEHVGADATLILRVL